MASVEQKEVVVELKNGDKCQGKLSDVDKVNFTIKLTGVKKTLASDPKAVQTFETLELSKNDIKEVKLIQTEAKPTDGNSNAIPSSKIPQIFNSQAKPPKSYDKNESFFDNLKVMSHPEAKEESRNYNNRNKDTFNLEENQGQMRFNNNMNHRGRGRGMRGHRGGNKGGYYKNNQYQNNNYNYNQGNNNNNYVQHNNYNNNNKGGYNNNYNNYNNQQNYQNNNNFHRGGRGRPFNNHQGNQNNRFRGNNHRGGKGGYNNYHRGGFNQNQMNQTPNNQNQNMNQNQGNTVGGNLEKLFGEEGKKLIPYQPEGDVKMAKGIEDK